eukprot:1308173-Ditylum_brightwellii.AAC.1
MSSASYSPCGIGTMQQSSKSTALPVTPLATLCNMQRHAHGAATSTVDSSAQPKAYQPPHIHLQLTH